MANHPLTGARITQDTDSPLFGSMLARTINELSPLIPGRFPTPSDRDAAYSAWTQAGGTLVDGMECWTGSGATLMKWARMGGAWLPAGGIWQSWTPTLTSSITMNFGTGAVVNARFEQALKSVTFQMSIKFGSSPAPGTGKTTVTLPPAMTATNANQQQLLTCLLYVPTVQAPFAGAATINSGSNLIFPSFAKSAADASLGGFQNADSSGNAGTGVPNIVDGYPTVQNSLLEIAGRIEVN